MSGRGEQLKNLLRLGRHALYLAILDNGSFAHALMDVVPTVRTMDKRTQTGSTDNG